MYSSWKFLKVENSRSITKEMYPDFYFELQHAVLLSLKDSEKLTPMQYRDAANMLKMQRNAVNITKNESGSDS